MEALTILSKYIGCYDRWQQIRKQYNLKWTNDNESIQALQRFFDNNLTLDSMLSKIRGMIQVLPAHMAEVVRYAVLTGLRPSEACESVRLIISQPLTSNQYYNQEQQTLEHFRYPDIFLRPTKKAFISYLSHDNYHAIASLGCKNPPPSTPTLTAICSAVKRKGFPMEMHLCRKVFASWLRKEGIEPEVVDLLQGRVSQSVLIRHYLTPSDDLKARVLVAVEHLQKQITCS
jgi:intergrase/recombinase